MKRYDTNWLQRENGLTENNQTHSLALTNALPLEHGLELRVNLLLRVAAAGRADHRSAGLLRRRAHGTGLKRSGQQRRSKRLTTA